MTMAAAIWADGISKRFAQNPNPSLQFTVATLRLIEVIANCHCSPYDWLPHSTIGLRMRCNVFIKNYYCSHFRFDGCDGVSLWPCGAIGQTHCSGSVVNELCPAKCKTIYEKTKRNDFEIQTDIKKRANDECAHCTRHKLHKIVLKTKIKTEKNWLCL